MKVKYLKDMHNARAGDVLDIPEPQANVLIKLKAAEQYKETAKKTVKVPKGG